MAELFNKQAVANYPQAPDLPMAIEGLQGTLFFVNFTGRTDVNYQINYAFSGDTYAYTFGDRLSLSSITGLAYPKDTCNDVSLDSTPVEFVKFYKKNKLGEGTSPLRITIGGMVLSGYFVSLSINLIGNQGASSNAYTFGFSFLGRVN